MRDADALDVAYRMTWLHAALSISVFLILRSAMSHDWLSARDATVPSLLCFGYSHVCLGLCIMAKSRAAQLRTPPNAGTARTSLVIGGYLLSGIVTMVGSVLLVAIIILVFRAASGEAA